ncbi:MAG: hypothetical protein HY094_02810 [Candidatus Melainabacteria bacterium]|nr:hypothetical protein [Candidatus Melainabacteria bacterium]
MKNKFSDLTNEELLLKLRENLDDNEMIFQEIFDREDNGRMKKGKVIKGSLKEYFQSEVNKSRKLA